MENALKKAGELRPQVWDRYIHYGFSICEKKNVERFLQYLNSRDQNIHFTLELEQNGELPFLDVRAQRTAEGKIKTGVHRKAMHSGRVLAFDSHHPVSAKAAVVQALLDRVNSHYAEPDLLAKRRSWKEQQQS